MSNNWNHLNNDLVEANNRILTRAFLPQSPAAVVPAVHLSRSQWGTICEIIRALSELHASCPNGLSGALIQGDVLADAAAKASEISFLAKSFDSPQCESASGSPE